MFITLLIILIVFFTVICVIAAPALTAVLIYRTGTDLSNISDKIENLSPSSSGYYFDLYSLAVNNNVSFELIGSDSTISYQSSEGFSPQSSAHIYSSSASESEYSQTQLISTYNSRISGTSYEKRRKYATNAEFLVLSRELSSNETLHIFSSVSVIDSNVEVATRVFTVICFIICITIIAFVYSYISKFTKPLEEMSDVTKDMAELNFARRCKPYGNDEIGELGNSINILSDTLDSTLIDLRSKNLQLENDIEHRREFISNVSHELKTPIAIISGYAEGLASGISDDPGIIHEYCEIIKEESSKMNDLVVELLELSKLESINTELVPAEYNLSEQIKEVISHFSLIASKNGISITNNVPDDIICFAQQDKIEIILKNYISNAVSHCSGDKKIIISCEKLDNIWRINVFNTGDKIAEEDINRIWESFYRADKAHSRAENRFGLGLSIVKAITEKHGMKCFVKNSIDGVTFGFEVSKVMK